MPRRAFTVRLGGVALGAALALGVVGSVLAAEESVSIQGFAFDPADLTVHVGDTVTWTNQDGATHTATADGGAFDTGNIGGGSSKQVTFSTAGTFPYHCSIHASMHGTITVAAAGSGGGATTPPTDTADQTSDGRAATIPATLLTILLGVAGVVGLWLGGAFARERIRRD
jgi:plastocyanin